MRVSRTLPVGRRGFTLIELLVVIAIMGVLMSILLAAVMNVWKKGSETANRNDINQLCIALEGFKTKYGVYPPSYFDLTNPASQQGQDAQFYLQTMFPRVQLATWAGPKGPLTGDQCLVFFLGGIVTPGAPPVATGFSTNPANPSAPGGERISPLYEFKPERLWQNGLYYSYYDYYGKTPFAYFSSYKTRNGYNRYAPLYDCASLNVKPYLTSAAGDYQKPDTFQLISAGADKKFGAGGVVWTPTQVGGVGLTGLDDQTNFNFSVLGAQ